MAKYFFLFHVKYALSKKNLGNTVIKHLLRNADYEIKLILGKS